MGSEKAIMRKTLEAIRRELEDGDEVEVMKTRHVVTPPNISSIERVGLLEGDDDSYGNPLHSTAVEEDINFALGQKSKPAKALVRKNMAGVNTGTSEKGRGIPKKRRSSAVKLRSLQPAVRREKRPGQGITSKVVTSPVTSCAEGRSQGSNDSDSVPSVSTSGVAPARRTPARSVQPKAAGLGTQKKAPAVPESLPLPISERPSLVREKRERTTSLSSEDVSDEDPSWNTRTGRRKSFKNTVSRQQSTSSEPKSRGVRKSVTTEKKKKSASGFSGAVEVSRKVRSQVVKNPIDLDIILAAFQDFVSNYKETLESNAVKSVISRFSNSVEAELSEMISETKGLYGLKRQNAKTNFAINQKRSALVEAKNQLIIKEAELRKLQKENCRLMQRLTDIRSSAALLADLRELRNNYLEYREKHPDEEEVYGPSSLPGLLLEARSVVTAEHQLSVVNQRLQWVLDQQNAPTAQVAWAGRRDALTAAPCPSWVQK